jgi:hypothetical protein
MKSISMTKKMIGVIAIALSGALHTGMASAQTTGSVSGIVTYLIVSSTGAVTLLLNTPTTTSCPFFAPGTVAAVTIPAGSTAINQWLSVLIPARLAGNTVSLAVSIPTSGVCTVTQVTL